jgi:hypothetical protein
MTQMTISAKDLGTLALPNFCPRCFWIRLHCENKLPFQIFPGIFSSIDSYTKKVTGVYFDRYGQLPAWLQVLGGVGKPVRAPHYSKFYVVDEKTNVTVRGTPDEIIQRDDGSYLIIDYKTAKFTRSQDHLLPLYEVQLNVYAYIGKRRGYDPISGIALVYMQPQTELRPEELDSLINQEGFLMGFEGHVLRLKLEPEQKIPPLLEEARRLYDLEFPPSSNQSCRDCVLLDQLIATATPKPID